MHIAKYAENLSISDWESEAMTKVAMLMMLVMVWAPACSLYGTEETCEDNPALCQVNTEAICLEEGTFKDDLARLESQIATDLLDEAFVEKSDEKLVEFLDMWSGTLGPMTCELFEGKEAMEQEAYRLYGAYYDPFNLVQYGDNEWGGELYTEFGYIVAQTRFAAETNEGDRITYENFRPAIGFDNAKVLYLTDGYQAILDNFLDQSQEDVWERYEFLRTRLPITPGHWGGWHFVTHPEVGLAQFQPDLQSALIYFRIIYQGGESTVVKDSEDWKLAESHLTWIE
jgi:hypothetical protein